MTNVLSDKSLTVLNYLKENDDKNLTAADIAEALGFEKKTIDGVVTSGLIRNRNYAERIPAEMELEDGTHKTIKLIKITEAGKAYDHEAAIAADAAAKASE